MEIILKKILLILFFLFQLPIANSQLFIAQSDSVFDESDLADIEGLDIRDEDSELEEEFGDSTGEPDNFELEDFEMIDTGGEDQEDSSDTKNIKSEEDMLTDDFNKDDYELLSDKPGYEIITDEELEQEFSDMEASSDESEEDDENAEDIDDNEDQIAEDIESEEDTESMDDPEDMELIDEPEDMEAIEDSEEIKLEDELENADSLDDLMDVEDTENQEMEESEEIQQDIETEESQEIQQDIEAIENQEDELDILEEELDQTTQEEEQLDTEDVPDEVDQDWSEQEESLGLDQPEVIEEPAIEGLPVEDGSADMSSLNLITNIRYLTEQDQVIIDTSEIASYQERRNLDNNQLIIEILQSQLGENLHWPYILRDFNTDFGLVKADQKDSSTVRVIIQLKEEADFPKTTLSKEGNQILIGFGEVIDNEIVSGSQESSKESDFGSILPAKTLEDLYFGNIEFSGAPVSFHVIDAPIKQVLRFISEESGLNMVIDESVSGTVTLKLEDVPWDQALHTIFKAKSLGYTRDGNVITILPLTKIEERTRKLKEISDRQKSLSPFQTKVIPVMYAKATDIEKEVKGFSTPAGQGSSKGGRIIVHEESNTLVVVDAAPVIKKISAMVKFLDKAPKQVMVEAKIVEVNKSFAKNFGFNWSLGGDLPVRIDASGIVNFITTALAGIGGSYSTSYSGSSENTFTVSGIPFIGNLNATLSLAEEEGSAQVLSTAKIVTKSGQGASINKNTPILILASRNTALDAGTGTGAGGATAGASQGANTGAVGGIVQETTQTQDIQLSLNVTPTVTSSGSISVKADITLSTPGGEGGAFKTDRTANTEVLTKNGQTLVISGIYQKNETKTGDHLPWLGNIPFIGWIFKSKNSNFAESEMLMFITPTLVD